MLYTTFNLLHEANACEGEYRQLAKQLGGIGAYGCDATIPLTTILDMQPNGLDNALWALRCCTEEDKARRLSQILACDFAEHVLPIWEKQYPGDNRPRECIAVARRFIDGKATREELDAADAAAWDAARAADAATRAAAWDAADAAARAATRAAAWDAADAARAAGAAARAAAWDAADAAARAAAWDAADAARAARAAAWDAADAAARAAAWDAARAARAAAWDAARAADAATRAAAWDAADAAARAAEMKWQAERFKELLKI